MELPFSTDAFLDVFGAYNSALWPVVVGLWVATTLAVAGWFRGRPTSGASLCSLLSLHWAWAGIAYHWFFFRGIDPAATFFAAAFVVQAGFFAWLAATSRAQFALQRNLRGVLARALVVYGLVYPFLGIGLGLAYPRLPLFGVPCPTVLVTAGLLLTSAGAPRFVNVLPVLWAGVGSSAAFALGVRADIALVVAGLLLGLDTLAPSALGPRPAASSAG